MGGIPSATEMTTSLIQRNLASASMAASDGHCRLSAPTWPEWAEGILRHGFADEMVAGAGMALGGRADRGDWLQRDGLGGRRRRRSLHAPRGRARRADCPLDGAGIGKHADGTIYVVDESRTGYRAFVSAYGTTFSDPVTLQRKEVSGSGLGAQGAGRWYVVSVLEPSAPFVLKVDDISGALRMGVVRGTFADCDFVIGETGDVLTGADRRRDRRDDGLRPARRPRRRVLGPALRRPRADGDPTGSGLGLRRLPTLPRHHRLSGRAVRAQR